MVTPIGTREARSSNVARRIIARIANRRNIDFSIPATLVSRVKRACFRSSRRQHGSAPAFDFFWDFSRSEMFASYRF
jgi:hypothetical protein